MLNSNAAKHGCSLCMWPPTPTPLRPAGAGPPRRLLLHAREIAKLAGLVAQKGLTVVPVRVYLKRGKVKLEIAWAGARS